MTAPHAANGAHPRRASGPAPRVLPHDLDAEAGVLGGIMMLGEIPTVLGDLESECFYQLAHRWVFVAMRELEAAGKPIDTLTVESRIAETDRIRESHRLEQMGGPAFITELSLRVPTVDNVVEYADRLRMLQRNRRVITELSSAAERAWTWPHEPEELLSETVGQLQRVEQQHADSQADKARWCIPLAQFFDETEPDDDDAVDWIVRDLVPRAEPVLWGGPMKGGKTWAVMDLLISIALGESWLGKFENTLGPARCLGLFLEDNKRRIEKRLWELCRGRDARLSPKDERIREHLRVSRSSIQLPDKANQRRLIAEVREWKPAVIVIDNLTRVMAGDPNSTRDASAFTRAWTEIGDETGATVLFLHHTKKQSAEDRDADPFDLLRGSGDFGATARNIVVTKPIRADNPGDGPKLAEVRMRGNLDLRRESFVLGFERKLDAIDRWSAQLTDRGEVSAVRDQVAKERKEITKSKKREEHAAEQRQRRDLALQIVHREGAVSQARLAMELGLKSPRSVADLLDSMVSGGVLEAAGRRGYVLKAEPAPQKGMDL